MLWWRWVAALGERSHASAVCQLTENAAQYNKQVKYFLVSSFRQISSRPYAKLTVPLLMIAAPLGALADHSSVAESFIQRTMMNSLFNPSHSIRNGIVMTIRLFGKYLMMTSTCYLFERVASLRGLCGEINKARS